MNPEAELSSDEAAEEGKEAAPQSKLAWQGHGRGPERLRHLGGLWSEVWGL